MLDSGTLSNEDNFLREASLCREIFTVVWRYWNTLFCDLDGESELYVNSIFFGSIFFFWILGLACGKRSNLFVDYQIQSKQSSLQEQGV